MSKVYPLAKVDTRVIGQGVTDLWRIQVGAYGKRFKDSGWQAWVTANEYVCATLGTLIGLPVPPFAMLEKRNAGVRESLWFASLSYLKEGENLPPVNPAQAYAELPKICAGVIVFDLWIGNTDRYEKNLSFDPNTVPKRLNVFDHGHALFGIEGASRLAKLRDRFTLTDVAESGANQHCLMNVLEDFSQLENWINRIKALPNFQIVEACRNALEMKLIDDDEMKLLLDFLLHRRSLLRDLLHANSSKFPSLKTLTLF